jgi:hypothetical protein
MPDPAIRNPQSKTRNRFDRHLWLAVFVAACVVVPRTALVSRAHSEYWDDQYHLSLGLSLLTRQSPRLIRNDPPLGQAVISLPMLATGCVPPAAEGYQAPADDPPGAEPLFRAVLYGHRLSPEAILTWVAVWKALLFLPFAGLVFHWCRSLYGTHGGWLGLAAVLVEPTVAGHIAPAALDVLGAEAIGFACYFAWRYFESPTRGRLAAAGVATTVALLTKHTAIILPAVVAAYALLHWLRDRRLEPGSVSLRKRLNQLLAGAVVVVASIWPLTLFDFSRPSDHGPVLNAQYTEQFSFRADVLNGALMRRWPAGVYVGSLRGAAEHAKDGHTGYLWGERRSHGFWLYYPALAFYKVPVGLALVVAVGAASLVWVKPKWGELPLGVAALGWAVFLILGGMHIGWRHFLPAYLPILMLSARCVAVRPIAAAARQRVLSWAAWVGIVVAAVHVHAWHPNYLSYVNWPRDRAYLAISDSNVDWGQGLKQVRRWLDENAQAVAGRPVWLGYFGNREGRSVPHYLGGRVRELSENDPAPSEGVLIISPVWVAGAYGNDQYAFLRGRRPDAVIGDSLLVYDLDRPGR